jgi:transcriptional regulator with GAF, ATPase, and Fis domain
MQPSLIVIAGPLGKDRSIPLLAEEVSIGRDVTNALCIASHSVSRRHCCIRRCDSSLIIHDLGSRNGTFVNGVPIRERELQDGDVITIGDAYFRCMMPAASEQGSEYPVTFEETDLSDCLTVSLRRESTKLEALPAAPTNDRVFHNLRALVTIATRIGSIQDSESLQWQVLGMVLEIVPAERGAILLCGEAPEDFSSTITWDKQSGPKQPVRISRTVVLQVLRDAAALLVNNASTDKSLRQAESLVGAQVHSIICAPLTAVRKTFGAIYLDSRRPAVRFDEGHLELLSSIAGMAAMALANIQRIEHLQKEATRLQAALNGEHTIVGESTATRKLLLLIAKVAQSDATVLLCGESGTGKELAARAIHRASERRDGPFLAINCAAIPEALLESELFGYEKGAFTGAVAQKKGQIEMANGGTLFLDEIGELAPGMQAKLLRVLQEREFTRVGGSRPVPVAVRVIAATNRDLAVAVKAGTFRQDLYYRLNVVSITLPSLRDRRDDIPLLANYFAVKFSAKCKRRVSGISPEAQRCLQQYDWPGNIRELENTIERAIVLGSSERIVLEDMPESMLEQSVLTSEATPSSFQAAVLQVKKQLIIKAVKEAGGNYTQAAKNLGLEPHYLHRLMRNLDIKSSLAAQ